MIEFADENEKTKKKSNDGGTPVLDNFSRDLTNLPMKVNWILLLGDN